MNWEEILGNVSAELTNAAQTAASYALPALAGGIAGAVMSAGTAALPETGTPAGTPIDVYSPKQQADAATGAPTTAAKPSTLPAWVAPAAVGALAVGVVAYLIKRK